MLALQRAAGNRATTRTVQRRLPDFAAVTPEIAGSSRESRVAEKKLKQVVKRTIAAIDERDQKHGVQVGRDAELLFQAQHPNVDYRTLLVETTQLTDAQKTMLGDLMAALHAAQVQAQRSATEVAYPRPDVLVGPPTGTQETVLKALVKAAKATMRDIAAGNHRAKVQHVFGARYAEAEKVFGESATALNRLFKAKAIIVDTRGDQEAVHAGGLTNKDRMALSTEVLASATPDHQAAIIHESSHAIDNQTTDDAYIDLTAGSAFLNATEEQKVGRAPYYEAVARDLLGLIVLPPFTPVNAGAQASQAQADVEKIVTQAWTVAINARDSLLKWAQTQTTATWTAQAPEQMKKRGTELANLSRALGLTIHHRMPASGHAPLVSDLDLTIAEDRAAQLSKLIGKAKNFTAQDDRTGTTWLFGKSTHDHLVDKILTQVVSAHGHSRKDPAKEEAMIRALASVYDKGREWKLMAALPSPLAGYYR